MTDFKIIENFLDKKIHGEIKNTMLGIKFPWYYANKVTNYDPVQDFVFNHIFWRDNEPVSNFFPTIIMPIIGNLKFNYLHRIKANAYTKKKKHITHGFHIDTFRPHIVALYSINTNNGFTEFENGKKIESIENRIVIFDGSIKHRSVTQTDEDLRVNINFDLIVWTI